MAAVGRAAGKGGEAAVKIAAKAGAMGATLAAKASAATASPSELCAY